MRKTVLVVDDEDSIRKLVAFNLEKAGYQVVEAANGASCLEQFQRHAPVCVILDIMLPDTDGFSLFRTLRQTSQAPVIFLTARDDEIDRVLGLELGGDDYVTKPFSPRELVARVGAVLRRSEGSESSAAHDEVVMGDLRIHRARFEVYRGDRLIPLTPKEFELLDVLIRHAGTVLTREQLLDQVWGSDYFGDKRVVDVHIYHLREKLELDPSQPTLIRTVRGIGYRLEGDL